MVDLKVVEVDNLEKYILQQNVCLQNDILKKVTLQMQFTAEDNI